jgi:hypothetical protein
LSDKIEDLDKGTRRSNQNVLRLPKAQVQSKGSVGAVFGFENRTATNSLCHAARFIVKKQVTWQAYPRQFNVHTSFILVSDILNNGEFVGFTDLVNKFEYNLAMNWIIRMHYID